MIVKKRNDPQHFDVIIIGAGASGLFAAIHAAERGRNILVIDHANRVGKKLQLSGGGKCNITNRRISTSDYYGADPAFSKFALKCFSPASLFRFLQKTTIETEEREHGRVFCKKGANEVVSYLVRTAENRGVHFLLNTPVLEVTQCADGFSVKCKASTYHSTHLLIATGGLAWPQIGATNLGYSIAKQFGHTILPLKPALSGFILGADSPLMNLQGISLPVQLQIEGKNKVVEEPLLFTHQGISGPAVLQASCFWDKGDVVVVNFLPSEDVISLMHNPGNGWYQVKNLITQFLPERLVKALLPQQLSGRIVAELSKNDRKIIAGCIHRFKVIPHAVEGFSKAEVTSGGISTHEINPKNMESLLKKGLFFSGEVIDITGRLGGYNIHWAFASGYVAGQTI